MRTIIDLPLEQIEKLDLLKLEQKESRAALIRQAVDVFLQNQLTSNSDPSESFGIWQDNPDTVNALEYQQKMRSEWSA